MTRSRRAQLRVDITGADEGMISVAADAVAMDAQSWARQHLRAAAGLRSIARGVPDGELEFSTVSGDLDRQARWWVSPDELAAFTRAAREHDVSRAAWVRAVLRHAYSSDTCQCGRITGAWCDAQRELIVEWMPYALRESHTAAGNRGRWPQNGSERLRISRSCYEDLDERDGWLRLVDEL